MVLSVRLKIELRDPGSFQVWDIGSEIKVGHEMVDVPANMLLLLDEKINIHCKTLLFLHHLKAKCYEIRFWLLLECLSWTWYALSC